LARILVAEDEERIRRILLLQLELEGYEVGAAASGQECLARVRTYRPDLLILDYLLPDLSGDEIIGALRRETATLSLPVILLSGLDRELIEPELLSDERVLFLSKPFENPGLLSLVEQALASVDGEQ
jgi:CheY-like chemotaxis protein